jgi:hypothetical protein
MVVAACKDNATDAKAAPKSGTPEPMGPGFPHGQPTTDLKPNVAGQVSKFEPENICAVYIKFESNGMLTVKQAHFAVPKPKPSDSDVVAAAEPWLNKMSKNSFGGSGSKKFKENFEDFTFSSQHVVVLYLDNAIDAVRFSETDRDIIRFTPISGNDPTTKIKANHAFFNRRKVALNAGGGTTGRIAYLLDFWNTKDDGDAITDVVESNPATHYLYSMNIHLQMATSKRTAKLNWVPIIIDPDTGNGGTYP